MADGDGAPKPDGGHCFGKVYDFQRVFREEIGIINARRALGETERPLQRQIALEREGEDLSGQPIERPKEDDNVVGLALSGGGIRSAAFCLGVLQALDRTKVLPKIDYLSTVSGGGYIGCSLTAAVDSKPGFPFASKLEEDEPPALQQLRNYSNYLFPRGVKHTLLRNASIYARGLAVNVVLVGQALFAASALTLLFYSLRWPHAREHFLLTAAFGVVVFCSGIAWGFAKSMQPQESLPEYEDRWARAIGWMIVVLFVVAFCELQPFILDAMHAAPKGGIVGLLIDWKNTIAAVLAPVGAAAGYLSNKLGEYLKSTMQSPQWSGPIKAVVLKVAIVVAGLILPLAIWVVYLDITYFGAYTLRGFTAVALYAVIAVVGFLVVLPMQPNANSLHPLYRDRLKKAFLFVPEQRLGGQDLPEFTKALSKIASAHGPYHLLNAALNVEASKTANRRGRNADFFVFSPKFVGSKTTGYVRTSEMEDVVSSFSFAAAMATSGAAVSSNMGAQNIKPLTATLALLNVRLGYWLRNPLMLADAKPHAQPTSVAGRFREFNRRRNFFANYYFVAEMFGLLSEKYKSIYLTDGGHIENLGIYELLRRRCRVIIAVDAEADPQMAFGSFNTLERYALIDLGVRIDLPWQTIADESLITSQAIDNVGALSDQGDGASGTKLSQVPKDHGPHCAIGRISYPNGGKGILVYIKASLTGDENDYIFDYKKRYSAFPHETTLDQMFTEEQFEAYRALGFHAAFRLFDRSDGFAYLDQNDDPDTGGPIGLLDRLFPRAKPPGEEPREQTSTFAAVIAAKAAAAKSASVKRPARGRRKTGPPSSLTET